MIDSICCEKIYNFHKLAFIRFQKDCKITHNSPFLKEHVWIFRFVQKPSPSLARLFLALYPGWLQPIRALWPHMISPTNQAPGARSAGSTHSTLSCLHLCIWILLAVAMVTRMQSIFSWYPGCHDSLPCHQGPIQALVLSWPLLLILSANQCCYCAIPG